MATDSGQMHCSTGGCQGLDGGVGVVKSKVEAAVPTIFISVQMPPNKRRDQRESEQDHKKTLVDPEL